MGKIRNSKGAAHRPGPLKQANKKHKTGRHKTKGEQNAQQGATRKVSVSSSKASKSSKLKRLERRKQASVNRTQKFQNTKDNKRAFGGLRGSPIFVSILPISPSIHLPTVIKFLIQNLKGSGSITGQSGNALHVRLNNGKNLVFIISPDKNDFWSALDILKLSDVTLLLTPNLNSISPEGLTLLKCAKDQGLSTPFLASTCTFNKREEKYFLKNNFKHFPSIEKIYPFMNSSHVSHLLRMITVTKMTLPRQFTLRSSMIIENSQSLRMVDPLQVEMLIPTINFVAPESYHLLQVTGIVRRANLNPRQLVHITGSGNYRILRIDVDPIQPESVILSSSDLSLPPRYLYDPESPLNKELEKEQQGDSDDEDRKTIDDDDNFSMNSDDLDEFFGDSKSKGPVKVTKQINPPKGILKMEMDMDHSDNEDVDETGKRLLPKGTSEYQADWFNDDSGSDNEELIFSDDEIETDKHKEGGDLGDDDDDEMDDMDLENEEEEKKLARVARDEAEFPDWIDTPMDQPAKVRFQKYRGLQSFKKSPWDVNENLPKEYSKIFQFQNYRQSFKKIVVKQETDGGGWIPIGQRVRMILQPLEGAFEVPNNICLFSLLRYEDRMTVMNLQLNLSEIIKNKETLCFQVGFRRFKANPILSEISPGDKHKMARIGQVNMTCMATVFAPIIFPNASVIAFKCSKNTLEPIAHGSLFSIDPARLILKRILLSGYPFKAQGRYAVVRFMFFNREDIDWFKPVELKTRYGRRGHIREPLGTHGHFKSTFDGQMKSQDTVLMPLYKRVFPKWTFDENVPSFWIFEQGANLIKPPRFAC